MAYCEDSDLLLGNIPLPSYINSVDKVQDAADEIDSMIGFTYVTPIDVSDGSDVPRPARLVLKRINSHLASGRLIMELASSDEQRELHQYGWSLVKQALATLDRIVSGEVVIEGAPRLDDGNPSDDKIIQINKDDVSQVDAFYDYFGVASRRPASGTFF